MCNQAFISCTKNSTDKTKTELLTTGGWRLESKQTKISTASAYTDITSGIVTCKKDDVLSFTNPSTYTVTEGATKCNAANADIVAIGTWALLNNQNDLKITVGTTSTTYVLYLVTENILTIDETDASGIVVINNRYTYAH